MAEPTKSHSDLAEELRLRIEELGCLLEAYRNGDILETSI